VDANLTVPHDRACRNDRIPKGGTCIGSIQYFVLARDRRLALSLW